MSNLRVKERAASHKHANYPLVARTVLSVRWTRRGFGFLGKPGASTCVWLRSTLVSSSPSPSSYSLFAAAAELKNLRFDEFHLHLICSGWLNTRPENWTSWSMALWNVDATKASSWRCPLARAASRIRIGVKLVGEDDLTDVLNHRLVILRMNRTGYWGGVSD